jgi:hypothetical protein
MAYNKEELDYLAAKILPVVVQQLEQSAQGVADVEIVTTLEGISSLPALKKVGGTERVVLAPLLELKGEKVHLRSSDQHIQWRHDNELTWTNLVALDDLMLKVEDFTADDLEEIQVQKVIDVTNLGDAIASVIAVNKGKLGLTIAYTEVINSVNHLVTVQFQGGEWLDTNNWRATTPIYLEESVYESIEKKPYLLYNIFE